MTSEKQNWESVKQNYLQQVAKALRAVKHPRRTEVLSDVTDHLENRYLELAPTERTWEQFQGIITDMGPASDYVELLGSSEKSSPGFRWGWILVGIIVLGVVSALVIWGPTRSNRNDPGGPIDPERFALDLPGHLARLDIDRATPDTIVTLLGKPQSYQWERQTLKAATLPDRYLMVYPKGVLVLIDQGKVAELRFEGPESGYVWQGKLRAGLPLADVLAVLGPPTETEVGKTLGSMDGVLYRDIDGREGHAYYGRSDHRLRLWFVNDRLRSIYMTRSNYGEEGCSKEIFVAEQAALRATHQWLGWVDAGQYQTAWRTAAAVWQTSATLPVWQSAIASWRQALGQAVVRTLVSQRYVASLSDHGPGPYVVIQFRTVFENRAGVIETIILCSGPDGNWRTCEYGVR